MAKALAAFFAVILTVIAVGVSLIAYGLLSPRAAAPDGAMWIRPATGIGTAVTGGWVPGSPLAVPASDVRVEPAYETYPAPRRVRTVSRSTGYPVSSDRRERVERSSGRNWTKTALVIGGSTAAGAGLGAIFGGKKGALIGAAIGGGASTLYESRQR